ncbi:hypothetical protein MANES_12G097520v8 [Manihot esculenta]|uniref:Uncharacterized protein n=1 Tax=Manihot esculenta TaxID=3983 RepID=A0ACB7GQS4_MANES|nr:hypothetical protein MANES_12G097520v8 [Manihot esculenta]
MQELSSLFSLCRLSFFNPSSPLSSEYQQPVHLQYYSSDVAPCRLPMSQRPPSLSVSSVLHPPALSAPQLQRSPAWCHNSNITELHHKSNVVASIDRSLCCLYF